MGGVDDNGAGYTTEKRGCRPRQSSAQIRSDQWGSAPVSDRWVVSDSLGAHRARVTLALPASPENASSGCGAGAGERR